MTRMKTRGVRARRRPSRTRTTFTLRSRVADAFREMARGVSSGAAQERSVGFYRSSGMAWAQDLR
jgi:hypothetical protein